MSRIRVPCSLVAIVFALSAISCNKNDGPSRSVQKDSLLGRPEVYHVDTVPPGYVPSGLVIDSLRMRSAEHEQVMARFKPKEVLAVYEDYRSLRKPSVTQEEIDSFLKAHKISQVELHAILEEGDRLGWSS